MSALILLGSFMILVAFGIPIAFCTGLSALVSLVVAGTPLSAVAQRVFAATDSSPFWRSRFLCFPAN